MSERRPIEILLIEDNPGDVRLLEEAFRDAAVDVRLQWVTQVDTALQILRPGPLASVRPLELILLDLNLPCRSGRSLLEAVRLDRRLRHVPVVVLTSSSSEEDRNWVSGFEKSWFFTKPMDMDALVELARRIAAVCRAEEVPVLSVDDEPGIGFAG